MDMELTDDGLEALGFHRRVRTVGVVVLLVLQKGRKEARMGVRTFAFLMVFDWGETQPPTLSTECTG